MIGRQAEVEALGDLARRSDVRLVTLVGPPGIGKTRLAVAVATSFLGEIVEEAFFVDLAPVADPDLILPTIAHTLGIRESARVPPLRRLADDLHDKRVLLVLDNFEQVVSGGARVSDLLAATSDLKILVTSREVLRTRWEHTFVVPTLAVPDVRQLPKLEALGANPSVTLFVQRARAVKPDFVLDPENAAAVAQICARLEGLPLAIELAAARARVLEPTRLLARLSQRLDLLSGGARDLPSRQQTLRGAIGWSDSLLQPEERALFHRLSVFVGGWDLEAVEALGGGDDPSELLASLVDKSLARREDRGVARFAMPEIVREYAGEELARRGEREETQRRHARYFLALAEAAEPELEGPKQIAWLDRLEREHDNLRAALRFSLESGDAETALRLSGALWKFWWVRGHVAEGQRWLDEALASSQGLVVPARARALSGSGNFARYRGDVERAIALHEESLAIWRALNEALGIATALQNLGMAWRGQGEYERARVLLDEGLALYREAGNQPGIALALNNLGLVARDLGDPARAASLHEESLALRRQLGDTLRIAHSMNDLGIAVGDLGNVARATALHQESLGIYRELQDTLEIGVCLERLAWMASARKQPDLAARLFAAAETLRHLVGVALPRPYGGDHERWLTATRTQLGDDAFHAAWSVGRSLDVDAAMNLAQATDEARRGETPSPLTAREREVADLIAQGLTNRQIASRLVISERTAEAHVANIRAKLGFSHRAQIAAWASSTKPPSQ